MNKFLFIFLLLCSSLGYSQITSDAQLWTGFAISKKVDNFKFGVNQEYRRFENFSMTKKMFTELEASYEFVKNLDFGITYRFNQDRNHELGGFDVNHRVNFDLGYSYNINDVKLFARTRYQLSRGTYDTGKLSRTKVGIRYKINKRVQPYISTELFYQFNDVRAFNRSRIELGNKLKINKTNGIKFGYLYENKFNRKNLEHNHIYFINYSLEI